MVRQTPWRQQARQKARSTFDKIPPEWLLEDSVINRARYQTDITGDYIDNNLPSDVVAVTKLEAHELLLRLARRQLTSEHVTAAFCRRAAVAHQLNNCLHEIFFDQALQRARQLDHRFHETGVSSGPLHGLPISLKDQFHVHGVDTTMGYVGWINTFEGKKNTGKERHTNSQIVDELLSLGAILYCKTSLPQTLLVGETHNNIIGYTMNPINQSLSCGGSSGGEGALQALRGSVLGVGTDIGGSVRIPSSFCGTVAIKPSASRFSYKNVANTNPGQTIVSSAIGFMSTSLLSLKLIMESIISTEPWLRDPELCPLPWRKEQELDQMNQPPLCFGILQCDGMVRPHPPILRALDIIARAAEKTGHKVVKWDPPAHEIGKAIHTAFMNSDGGADIFNQLELSGEPLIPELAVTMGRARRSPISLSQYQDLCLQRNSYRELYAKYWESTSSITETGRPVDALIMPVAPHAAVIPGKFCHYGYTEIVNLLDYTSVTIPITRVNKVVDVADKSYKPMNGTDHFNWMQCERFSFQKARKIKPK